MRIIKSIDSIVHHLLKNPSQKKKYKSSIWVREMIAALLNLLNSILISIAGLLRAIVRSPLSHVGFANHKNNIALSTRLHTLFTSAVGGMLSIVGHFLYWIGIIIRLVDSGRTLTEKEKQVVSEVFQHSVNAEFIRIIELPFWNNYYFVLHNYIFTPSKASTLSTSLLIHEVVHIWQFHEQGCSYIFNALAAQIRYGRKNIPGNAYDWTAEIKRGKTNWQDFNKEAAAQFMEEVWNEGAACIYSNNGDRTITEVGNGIFFRIMNEASTQKNVSYPIMISKRDLQDYSALAIQAIDKIRSKNISKKEQKSYSHSYFLN